MWRGGGDLVSRDISRYRCCVVGRGGGGIKYLETFRDIGAFLWEGGGIKYLETFRDIGAVGGGGRLIIMRHFSR